MSSIPKTYGDALAALVNDAGSGAFSIEIEAEFTYRPNLKVSEVSGDKAKLLIVPRRPETEANTVSDDQVTQPYRLTLAYDARTDGELDDDRIEDGNALCEELMAWLKLHDRDLSGANIENVDWAPGKAGDPLLFEEDLASGRYVQRLDIDVVTDVAR